MLGLGGSKAAVGSAKEGLACRYLERHGLRLVARNWRCRHGEIDLVMLDPGDSGDDGELVFVEVRYRRSERFGGALASVDRHKQRKLRTAAGQYLQLHPSELPCRFDVLAIGDGDAVHWIRSAFDEA
jgi:putative endonuclease